MIQKIMFNSAELAAFHEAGHVETALQEGVTIVGVELYRERPRSYGRTRTHKPDTHLQRMHVALGGFAAEFVLYRASRLVKEDGQPPTEKEFLDHVFNNAVEDRISYFGQDLSTSGL